MDGERRDAKYARPRSGREQHNSLRLILKQKNPPGRGATERVPKRGWNKHPNGHHIAVFVVVVELCDGRPAGGRSAPAVSELLASAHWLGWLLALVACALLVERIWTRRGRQPASIFARHARPLGNGVAMQHYHGRERVTQTVLNSNKVGLLRLDRWT